MKPSSSFPMQLAPLPAARFEDSAEPAPYRLDGFVDDEVIASILSQPLAPRVVSSPSDLVLSSDENDFAGFSIHGISPFRIIAEKQELASAAAPVVVQEPGLGQPHRGAHRWWIAAAAGAAAAMILSLLFAHLAERPFEPSEFANSKDPFSRLQSALGSLAP